jgi:hypothetical protein
VDTLNAENAEQAIVPPSMQQIGDELKEATAAITQSLLGNPDAATLDSLPLWYVIGKAAGASGIKVQELLNDPIARMFALGIYIVEINAANRAQEVMKKREAEAVRAYQG